MAQGTEMRPEALVLEMTEGTPWTYEKALSAVRTLYVSWKTVSESLLHELWLAKQVIVVRSKKKELRPDGSRYSWKAFVSEAFGEEGPSLRTIDSYLDRYFESGMNKPDYVTINVIDDPDRLIIQNARRVSPDRIEFDVYLPEFDVTYHQAVNG